MTTTIHHNGRHLQTRLICTHKAQPQRTRKKHSEKNQKNETIKTKRIYKFVK